MYDDRFMQHALALSARALQTPGTEPFGAVVVCDGSVVGEGFNHAVAHHDPTSHGEIEAIRDACRRLQRIELSGCDLYTSCEPCALCMAATHIVGIRRLYYAASLQQSDAALAAVPATTRPAIDIDALRAEAGAAAGTQRIRAEQQQADAAVRILEAWARAQAPR